MHEKKLATTLECGPRNYPHSLHPLSVFWVGINWFVLCHNALHSWEMREDWKPSHELTSMTCESTQISVCRDSEISQIQASSSVHFTHPKCCQGDSKCCAVAVEPPSWLLLDEMKVMGRQMLSLTFFTSHPPHQIQFWWNSTKYKHIYKKLQFVYSFFFYLSRCTFFPDWNSERAPSKMFLRQHFQAAWCIH